MKLKLLVSVVAIVIIISFLINYMQTKNTANQSNIENKTEGMHLDINNPPLGYIKPEYIKDKDSFISESCKKEPNRYYYTCSFSLQNTDFLLDVNRICSYYETYTLYADMDKTTIRDIIKPEYLDTAYNNSIRITDKYYPNTNPPQNETVFRTFNGTENGFTITERRGIWFPIDPRPIYYTMSDTDIQIRDSVIKIMYKFTYLQC